MPRPRHRKCYERQSILVTKSTIRDKLNGLPKTPGVYIMKNAAGEVIYVGKAVALKNRVSNYFNNSKKDSKTAALVAQTADFDYILTETEIEALILECNMIKRYSPYYNILLRDDKHYPYIRIDMRERFPRISVTRRVENDGAKYYGPYIAANLLHEVLDAVTKIFPVRLCKKELSSQKGRPCLNYEMGRCLGPCAGKVGEYEYKRMVSEVEEFLLGRYKGLRQKLEQDMKEASNAMEYERAASIRDSLQALKLLFDKQKAGFPDLNDKDIFAVYQQDDEAVVQGLFVRKGELNHTERFFMSCAGEPKTKVISHLLGQYYSAVNGVAKQIYVNAEPWDKALLEQWLTKKRGSKVAITVPLKGDNKKLTQMALTNAKEALERRLLRQRREYDTTLGAVSELAAILALEKPLSRIECYDVSNTQGTDSVASMVVFRDGKAEKKSYRRFKIKTVTGADDFASLNEVLTRRLKRALEGSAGFEELPDLIVADGGKGQLLACYDALASLGLEDKIALISIAEREEQVFTVGQSEPLAIDKNSNALGLLVRIRDEAHRFAITYHRGVRLKNVGGELLKIPHVGKTRAKALLKHFETIGDLRAAGFDQIISVPGMDIRSAQAVVDYFESDENGT